MAALVFGTSIAGLGWAAAETLRVADDHRFLPGAVVDNVAVGGLTPAQAATRIEQARGGALDRIITVSWPTGSRHVTPRTLGTVADVNAAAARSRAAARDLGLPDLARIRWAGQQVPFSSEVLLRHDTSMIEAWVDELAAEIERDPVDASADWSSGSVEFVHDRPGLRVNRAGTVRRLRAALDGQTRTVTVPTRTVRPQVTAGDLGQILLLRQDEFRLYLYDEGELVNSWPVAIGAPRYRTPAGDFTVTRKRYLPTWGNPAPNGWGKGMPLFIGPGPGNPLGLRALNWSVGAIRFHGTSEVGSIGRAVSKGCVRLTNRDVIELYDLVDEGARIISIRST